MIDTQSKSHHPWWLASVLWALGVTAVAGSLMPLEQIDWRVYLGMFATLFTVACFWNPNYRYFRLATQLLAFWGTTRLGAVLLNASFKSESQSLAFSIQNEVDWPFDAAIAVCILAALILDCVTRNSSPFGRYVFLAIAPQQQNKGNQGQAVAVNNNSGTVHISYSQSPPPEVLDQAIASAPSQPDASRDGGFHDQIDAAAAYLKEDKIEAAIEWLLRIRKRNWDRLNTRERFRVLANLGHCRTRQDDFSQALADFKEALSYQPDEIEAQCFVAAAEFSAGNDSVAQALAQKIVTEHPAAVYARAVLLRTTPPDKLAESLWKDLPSELRTAGTIVSALAWRGLRNEEFAFVRRLLAEASDPALSIERDVLTAVVTISTLSRRIQTTPSPTEGDLASFTEAITTLEAAIEKMERLPGKQQCAQAYYYLAKAYELLGKSHLSDSAYKRAIKLWPKALDIAREYVRFLVKSSRLDDAIAVLDSSSDHRGNPESQSLLAGCLAERDTGSDRARAVELLKGVVAGVSKLEPVTARNSLYTLCILLAESAEIEETDRWINHAVNGPLSRSHRLSIKAAALLKAGQVPAAIETCQEAIQGLADESPICLADVADICRGARLFGEAVDVYLRYISPDSPPPDVLSFLESAHKAQRDETLLSFCQRLRDQEVIYEAAIELEAYTREKYDDDEGAVAALDAYLARKKTGRFAALCRLRKAILGLKYGHADLWQSVSAGELPSADEADGHIGGHVVTVLREQGKRHEALEYAYALLRRNPNDPFAHRAYVAAVGLPGDEINLPMPVEVTVGCAVEYQSISSVEKGWWVIENGPNQNFDLHEIAPTHPLAEELLGKKVGDDFVLRASSFQQISAKVLQILDNRAYRLRTTIDGWEERFQNDPFVWKLEMGRTETGELDPTPLLKALDSRATAEEQLKRLYLENPLSVASFSVLSGVDPYDAATHLAADTELPVRCCLGNDEEYQRAVLATASADRFVVCPSTLATLWLLRNWETFADLSCELIIAKSTLVQMRFKKEEGIGRCDTRIWKEGSHYVHAEADKEAQDRTAKEFDNFLSWVTRSTTQVDGTALASLSVDQQNNLMTIFGKESAQSIAIAKQSRAVLWTDDLGLAEFSRLELEVPRTWTEVLLAHLKDNECISETEYARHVAKLNSLGFTHTRLIPEALCEAAKVSSWEPHNWLFVSAVRWCNSPGLDPRGVAQIVSRALPLIWHSAPLPEQAHSITVALFEGIAENEVGRAIATAVQRHIHLLFGVDAINAQRCHDAISEALTNKRPKRLFDPGDGGVALD